MTTPKKIMARAYQAEGLKQGAHIDFAYCQERMGAAIQALEEAGYAITPVEPTQAMLDAAALTESAQPETQKPAGMEDIWQAMIAASKDGE